MAEEQTIKASAAFVRNLGNYQTLKVELAVTRGVPEGVPYLTALDKLKDEVLNRVQAAIEEVDEAMGHEKVRITLESK